MQNAVFDALQAMVVRLDAEATLITPGRDTFSKVIRSHQNGPRPEGAYAMLVLQSETDTRELDCRSYADIILSGGGPRVVQTNARVREFLFDIEVFASDALDRARAIANGMNTPGATVSFPYTIRNVGSPRFIGELVQQRWEGRALFTVSIAARINEGAIIDTIETVPVTLDPDGTKPTAQTFTITKP